MSLLVWIGMFTAWSLFATWVLRWGGAAWMEGWKSLAFVDSWGSLWDEAQIKLYFLCLWIVYGLWFVAGTTDAHSPTMRSFPHEDLSCRRRRTRPPAAAPCR